MIRPIDRWVWVLFVVITGSLVVPSICSGYYADINISVDDSGFVTIDGNTDYDDLLVKNSELFTYKKQSYWLLNITIDEVFSDYVYTLSLPQGSTVNYIKSSGFRGITEESGRLILSGSGGDEPLSIVVQYQINRQSLDVTVLSVLGVSIGILIVLLGGTLYYNRRKKSVSTGEQDIKDVEYDVKGLSERQRQIIHLLLEAKRPLTQGEIEKTLQIPKSAVSRNVHSLELKGLIEIENIGMSNLIRLKKP